MHKALSSSEVIGFIGLGTMGSEMVAHLLEAGYEVNTWSRTPSRLDRFSSRCLVAHSDSASVFRACSIAFLNVTATEDVEHLLFSKQGAFDHMQAGGLIVDFSTIDSRACVQFQEQLLSRQIELMDCPVSGGQAGAQASTLTMMAGGSKQAFERAEPFLRLLGKTLEHVGPCGAGQAIKAANQMAMCIQLAGLAEAFNYAKTQGADLQACFRLLSAGLAGSKVLDWAGPHMVEGFTRPATIQSRLHAKDMAMIAQSADQQKLNLPLTRQTAKALNQLVESGLGHEDTSRLFQWVAQNLRH
ncbi:MAG: NAD(P)-dependent oxidoreductase [Limnobacter sp.]|nr:NAD(P)-dependent oxidoreductase [Limnobacter sp.]